MPFSKETKALTKNSYQLKKYGSRRIVTEFSKINCEREELDTIQKDSGNVKHRPHAREQQIKHARTEEYVITVDELASLLSQEGQNKHFARYTER